MDIINSLPDMEPKHKIRLEAHRPAAEAVLQRLPVSITVGKRTIKIDGNLQSINFIRGLIQFVEKTQKGLSQPMTYEQICNGDKSRVNIVSQYGRYLNDFLEAYNQPFDKVFYLREQHDRKAFGGKELHRQLYTSRSKIDNSFEEKDPTQIYDEKGENQLVKDVSGYCKHHTDEKVFLYIGGHGYPDGSIRFGGGDALTAEDFKKLTSISNLTLEVDSCESVEKFRGSIPEAAGVFVNSEADNSANSYDDVLEMARDRYVDMSKVRTLYQDPEKFAAAQTKLEDAGIFGVLADDASTGMLTALGDYTIYHLKGSSAISLGGSFDTYDSKNQLRQSVEAIVSEDKDALIRFEAAGNYYDVPAQAISAILGSCTRQAADYDGDGSISYAETRIYTMQRYTHSFVPTLRKNPKGGYIKLAEATDLSSSSTNSAIG